MRTIGSLQAPLDPLGNADRVESWHDDRCTIVRAITENTPESVNAPGIVVDPATGDVLVAWSRLDRRDELLAALGKDAPRQGLEADDSLLLSAAYRRWGTKCVEHLVGAFAVAVWNPRASSVWVARDQIGFRPVFWSAEPGLFVVSTTAAAMRALPELELAIDDEWLAQFIVSCSESHDRTPWLNVHKLVRGHHLVVEQSSPKINRWHSFVDDAPDARTRDDVWVEAYRAELDQGMADRLRTKQPLGCETSGGLDSSTCLALAAGLWNRPVDELHAFGRVSWTGELELTRAVNRVLGLADDHIRRPFDFPALPESQVADILGYPAEHGAPTSYTGFYLVAKELGVRTLLSGFGGDEVVTNPGSLLRTELIADRRFAELYRVLPGASLLKPARFIRALQAWRPAAVRNAAPPRSWSNEWQVQPLRIEVAQRWDLQERSRRSTEYMTGFERVHDWSLNRQFNRAYGPTRLETCMVLANAFGVEYRWPMLDARLIQQWFSTPSIEKYGRGGVGRYLHRRAIDGIVPDEVTWKSNKSMGDPLGIPAQVMQGVAPLPAPLASYHPRLEALIDRPKLERLNARSEPALRPTLPLDPATGRRIRPVRRLATLQRWLDDMDG